jgi:hypothetical protein
MSHVVSIPIQNVKPHPKLAFRFRYDVDSLADSIIATADKSTPNGQLNPGRVVRTENGDGYHVYIGVRRFLALKLAFGRTNDPRFGVFNAYMDEGLSELQMFVKAKAENEDERGERQPVSLLELVSGIRRIRDSVDPGKVSPAIKRLVALADKMEDDRLKQLREAEWAAHSRFKSAQLEGLAKIEGDDREFFTTAAAMVGFGEQDAESARKKRDAAFHLSWFSRAFPEIKREPAAEKKEEDDGEAEDWRGAGLEIHEDGVILAVCPRCGGRNMLKVEGQLELTHLSPDPKGEAKTIVADAVGRVRLSCSHCSEEWFVLMEPLGGQTYAIMVTDSGEFREPNSKTAALDLRYDFAKDEWQRVADGRIVGEVLLTPAKRTK